jgi:hypothetical protein
MIIVRLDAPGLLTIDFSGETGFRVAEDGVELTSALFVKDFSPQAIVVEDAGQLVSVAAYIRDFFAARGYETALDAELEKTLKGLQDEEELAAAIRSGSTKSPKLDSLSKYGVNRRLLRHQLSGLLHALSVRHGANFSVPGSGKTATALAVYAVLLNQSVVDRMLVVGPASSFDPWEEEFGLTFGRNSNTVRLIGSRAERAELLRYLEGVDLLLATYQMAYRERESLARILRQDRYLFVLDESHHIKNIDLGPWARTAIELAPLAARRMILTGTPLPHSPKDLWSQFTFLWPSSALLGSRTAFERRVQALESVEGLRQDLGPFFVRTKKSDLKLPEPLPHFSRIPYKRVPRRQRLIIRLLELKTLQEARDLGLGRPDVSVLRRWRKARTIRLLQAASNPALLATTASDLGYPGEPLDEEPVLQSLLKDYLAHETPAKVDYVIEKTRQLVRDGNKVVIWAFFVDNLRLLRTLLEDLNPLLVYGAVPPYEEDDDPEFENRERNIREFKTRSDRSILIANPTACSESISLHTVCHNAVYLERTFNCGHFLQSMDRIHRVGMPSGVRPEYHIPLIPCAVENIVDRRLRSRQEILYRLLDDDMPVLGFEDESLLLEREDDLEVVFKELLSEISREQPREVDREPSRGRSRR